MKQIMRLNSFETNSSTSHTMIILSEEEYEKAKKEEIIFDWNGEIISVEECRKIYEKEADTEEESFEDWMLDNEYYTLENWQDDDMLESESHTYTTKGGEILHIICKYGYDG